MQATVIHSRIAPRCWRKPTAFGWLLRVTTAMDGVGRRPCTHTVHGDVDYTRAGGGGGGGTAIPTVASSAAAVRSTTNGQDRSDAGTLDTEDTNKKANEATRTRAPPFLRPTNLPTAPPRHETNAERLTLCSSSSSSSS